jgi:hypothetical protein
MRYTCTPMNGVELLGFDHALLRTPCISHDELNVSLNADHVDVDCLDSLVKFLLAVARDEDIGPLFDEELCCR